MMEESNLSQQDLECANVALAQDPTTLGKVLQSNDANKWEASMEDEHNFVLVDET
jgi:hypothetical protein